MLGETDVNPWERLYLHNGQRMECMFPKRNGKEVGWLRICEESLFLNLFLDSADAFFIYDDFVLYLLMVAPSHSNI